MSVAYGYVRVSRESQVESGLGLEAQRASIEDAARRLGLTLDLVFSDEGLSGGLELSERPGLLDAVGALMPGDTLLVAARSRLGRDVVNVALVEREVTKRGARIVSAAGEGSELEGPTADLVKTILDAVNAFEKAQISLRTRAALRAKKARGERMGNPPFGYRIDVHGQLIPHKGEQRIIEGIAIMRRAGCSVRQITDELRRHGVVGRKKTHLAVGQVWALLKKLPSEDTATR